MKRDCDEALLRTARAEAGLPSPFFVSEEAFALEVERFFRRQWFCVGLSVDVPRVGDWRRIDALNRSVLLVRSRAGDVRAFHNVCSHRGAQLLADRHHGPTIVCPYHCWTYDVTGRLIRTPHAAGAGRHDDPEIDRSRHGLRELKAREHAGLVFVCFDEPLDPFETQVAVLAERWAHVDFSRLQVVSELAQKPSMRANWKIAVENFVESYHLPWIHPDLESINPMQQHYQILGGIHYVGQGSEAYDPQGVYETSLPVMPGLEGRKRARGESLYLPPNLLLIWFPDFFLVNILMPRGASYTDERLELFVLDEAARESKFESARAGLMRFLASVNDEDIAICESVQRGRASEAFEGGVFARQQETSSLQFQQILARRLLGQQACSLPALPVENLYHRAEGAGSSST